MTFLQLVQSLIAECGASGTLLTTTVAQSGENLRFVNWTIQSWMEIQNNHLDWGFMRSSYLLGLPPGNGVSFPTTSGRANYPLGSVSGTTCMVPAANFRMWDEYSFRNYSTSDALRRDEIQMDLLSFDDYRDSYQLGALRSVVTRPVAVAIGPDSSINIGPPSNGLYTIEADFWTMPQTFVNDVDVPTGLPANYHMLIVYRGMKKYARYEAAPEVATGAEDEYRPMYSQLEAQFAPRMIDGPALA